MDALLPPQCPLCRAPVDGPHRLCAACFGRLNFITAPFCQRCGLAFATLGEAGPQGQCLGCLHREPRFARARAALVYDEAAQPLILPFKHADRTELAPLLAAMMARAGQLLLAEADAIIPVPLHRRRLIARRYNQAALLAAWLARQSRRPWLPDTLTRPRATTPLGELSASARGQEVSGAFAIRPARLPAIQGKRLLLIDDVMTSGATASACAAVALQAGRPTSMCSSLRGFHPRDADRNGRRLLQARAPLSRRSRPVSPSPDGEATCGDLRRLRSCAAITEQDHGRD